jgi:hypothetical protein
MKKIKFNSNIIYLIIVILVILMFIFGKRGGEEIEVLEEELISEESAGSGFLEVETFPDGAKIYVDRLYSGDSPTTLYNVPAGLRNIIIKKEGYEDFIGDVSIEPGKKTFLETRLVLIPVAEENVGIIDITDGSVEVIEVVEEKEEDILTVTPKSDNIINIGNKFILYYDFSEGKFTDKRDFEQDIFSKRYAKHLVFTRINPVNIKTIDKNIDDVGKDDCAGVKGQFEFLNSGQSLCVITKEGGIAAIGGTWDDTENAELKWKVFG